MRRISQRQQRRSLVPHRLALVPTLVLMVGLFLFTLSSGSSWLPAVVLASFLSLIVMASLLISAPSPYSYSLGTGAILLVSSGVFLTELFSLQRDLDWAATGTPALFLLFSGIAYTRAQRQPLRSQCAAWAALLLFIGMLYLADLSGNWWLPGSVSLGTLGILSLVLRFFPRRQRYLRSFIFRTATQLTGLALLSSCILGFTSFFVTHHGIWQGYYGTGAAWITGLCAIFLSARQLLRTRLLLWSLASYPAALLTIVSITLAPGPWSEALGALLTLMLLGGANLLAYRLPIPPRRLLDRLR